ncbi:LamG domain-containing protein [Ideonella sp.]|uniref:LamG domain-containing protein n=1 Tax=Ideonella sp. TaxID=1929293 RepID=UPI002B490662|nr:LamG domain-containing protein [Ideonella sp.]HJV69181.1 LamG domain-containing protein [Ideonella sp.]
MHRLAAGLTWPAALAVFALVLAAAPAGAATYTFRSDTYAWETTTNTITWDRSCTGYPGDDDKATITFPGGFSFNFGGTNYNAVRVLSNGMLQFGADTGFFRNYVNTTLPAGNADSRGGCTAAATARVMMAYWADLDPSRAGSGNVTWEQKGTAPNRYLVVSWNSVYEYGTNTPYAFQIILYENGEFKYQYGNANTTGSNATIGVQVSNSDYTLYSFNSGYNANGSAIRWFQPSGTPTRLAEYRMDEFSWSGNIGEVTDSTGNGHGGVRVGAAASSVGGYVCRGADIPANTNASTISAIDTSLDVDTGIGVDGAVTFWYRSNAAWTSSTEAQLLDASGSANRPFFLVRKSDGTLRFVVTDSAGNLIDAASSAQSITAGTWTHIAVSWRVHNGSNQSTLRIYVNGQQVGARTVTTNGALDPSLLTLFLGDNRTSAIPSNATAASANGRIDEVKVYNYEISALEIAADMAVSHGCPPPLHHVELRHGTGTGLTCTPSTLTVVACQDAACSSLYTAGLTGTLAATGAPAVTWPDGAAFSIASGASSTTVRAQVVSAGSVSFGTTGLSVTPASATSCTFGSPACSFSAEDSGLRFDVPNHVADSAQSVSVSAVKKADNSNACVPAFAGVSKPITFRCSFQDPASGTLPVRVGGTAVQCGAGSQAVTLAFDATGTASTTLQYADVGQVALDATYTGSGSDAGLTMTGSDSFIAAPYTFTVAAASGTQVAGVGFSATVTAQNASGATTPNFGREAAPESVTLGWVRTQPQASGAVNGTWTGSVGSFASGSAAVNSFQWSEVGRGDLSAVLASGNYLASGYTAAGSSAGTPVLCASEWGTCVLPAGATATIYYGRNGRLAMRSGMTGNVWCANAAFGDPDPGYTKQCWYVATGGSSAASNGAIGPFRPHHFDVAVTPACAAGNFGYAGQPIPATITAKNASGGTTSNYFGSYAKATTLSDAGALAIGGFTDGATVPAASYTLGVANAAPTYGFTDKLTAPQTLAIRATDADGVSSSGHAEGSTPLRSGRLLVANGYGSENSALQLALRVEYWSGKAWLLNGDDGCTGYGAASIPTGSVALSSVRDHKGGAGSWTTNATAITMKSNGVGTLTLAAPSGGATGTVDLALNLGAGTADESCLANHPASTGAVLPWLRSRNGSCATGWASDPSARAAFGIYSPESKKTVHVREIF